MIEEEHGRKRMKLPKAIFMAALALSLSLTSMKADAKNALKTRKIGVIVMSLQSESLAVWAKNLETAAAELHWTVVVKDGENNPAVVSTRLPELVAQGVDAVITMAVDAPLLAQGFEAAKAKGIPVIATTVGVSPAGKEQFAGVYAVDDYALGVALADYLVQKNPKVVAVGQTASVVYAADQLVVGAKETLAKRSATMARVADVDVTNLVTSFTQTTTDLVQAYPNATALVSCCDFAPLMDLSALKSVGRSDITLLTRVDNQTSLQAIRAGAPLVVAAFRDVYNLAALDVLAQHFAKNAPIPATLPNLKADIKVIDKSNAPTEGRVYPFEEDLAAYAQRWASEYEF
jgi:ABC-type sugar transport system substrate-binding protein